MDTATRIKRGTLSQMERLAHYLHAEYDITKLPFQALTILFPHNSDYPKPNFTRIGGERDGFTGVRIEHHDGSVDLAIETVGTEDVRIDGWTVRARVAILQTSGPGCGFFVRDGTKVTPPTGSIEGFSATRRVSGAFQAPIADLTSRTTGTELTFGPGPAHTLTTGMQRLSMAHDAGQGTPA